MKLLPIAKALIIIVSMERYDIRQFSWLLSPLHRGQKKRREVIT